MILVLTAALYGCTYSSGTKVATGARIQSYGSNESDRPNKSDSTGPARVGTPTPVAPTNPAPVSDPNTGNGGYPDSADDSRHRVSWNTLTTPMPINPVHGILLKTGNVLYIAGSGNCPPGQAGCPTGFGSATVWNPTTGAFNTFPIPYFDMFCNGATQMADGRIFIDSGTADVCNRSGGGDHARDAPRLRQFRADARRS